MHRIYSSPNYTLGSDYMVTPGARLEVGPRGKLYQTLGEAEAAIKAKAGSEATKAAAEPDQKGAAVRELARMKNSLKGWLKYRGFNDEIASGKRPARVPPGLAKKTLMRDRDWAGEQKLADDLYLMLSMSRDPSTLPAPDVTTDPDAAVKLACIALSEPPGSAVPGPQATGIWPLVLIGTVGVVVLFTITSFISNRAEVQKEKERIKCINDGGCTDYGFWLKTAGVLVVGYFAWEKLGIGDRVKRLVKG